MRKIECITRPFILEKVEEALSNVGVQGIRVSEVLGFGHNCGHTKFYRTSKQTIEFVPKLKIEIVVADEIVDEVVEVIKQVASAFRTDQILSTAT